jgi:hypothetical protein
MTSLPGVLIGGIRGAFRLSFRGGFPSGLLRMLRIPVASSNDTAGTPGASDGWILLWVSNDLVSRERDVTYRDG